MITKKDLAKQHCSRALQSRRLCAALLVIFATALPLAAGDGHEHHRQMLTASQKPANEALGSLSIPDTVLLDQDGTEVRFYSDLIRDKVVVVNFIFTTCTTICPPMGANFSKLQKMMRERPDAPRAGIDFEMISISVDPTVDTPQRLNQWAKKFGREPGWTLLTGSKVEVDHLLKALRVFTPSKHDHTPILLLGDAARDEWTRAYGLAPPAKLATMVENLIDTKGAAR